MEKRGSSCFIFVYLREKEDVGDALAGQEARAVASVLHFFLASRVSQDGRSITRNAARYSHGGGVPRATARSSVWNHLTSQPPTRAPLSKSKTSVQ